MSCYLKQTIRERKKKRKKRKKNRVEEEIKVFYTGWYQCR
jgi:hypothetical protein